MRSGWDRLRFGSDRPKFVCCRPPLSPRVLHEPLRSTTENHGPVVGGKLTKGVRLLLMGCRVALRCAATVAPVVLRKL